MLCNNSCEHVSFLRFSSKICLNIIEYLFKLFNSSWLFGGSSESQHSRPKFPYLSKRVLSDYRMLFHTKKNEASTNWRTAATIAGTVKMIRCGPPYGKRKHCCYWLKHWGKKNAHHNDCACWKYSQSIESISKTILGSSCRTCASICWNLVFTSYEHRTWWINCAIVSCSFRKTTGSCSKCLAKESLWLSLAGKIHVDYVLLLKAVPHQVLTHILSASLVAQKSIRQPEGNYWKPKIPALMRCVTDDLSPLFSRQKLRKHPSPNCDPRCANKFWSISWSPRLTLASKWAAAVGWKLLIFNFWEKGISC